MQQKLQQKKLRLKMSPSSKEFKDLESLWYQKLKDDGFEDIEVNESTLKGSSFSNVKRLTGGDKSEFYRSKEEYFRLAGFFLHDTKFIDRRDKLVWEFHTNGDSLQEISNRLKRYSLKIAKTQVKETVHRLRDQMYKKYRHFDHE